MNSIYGSKRLAGNFGAWHAHAEGFLHAYRQFEGVDRVEAKAIRAEERKVISDLVRSGLQHQIFDQHLFNKSAQIGVGHKRSGDFAASRGVGQLTSKISFDQQLDQTSVELIAAALIALNLISFAAGLIAWFRVGPRFAARWLGLDSGHRRFRRFYVRLRRFVLRFPGLMQLVAELVLGFLKLLHCLAHSAREFW